jgi:hypothetical protein
MISSLLFIYSVIGFQSIKTNKDVVDFTLIYVFGVNILGMLASLGLNWLLKYYSKLFTYQTITLIVSFLALVVFFITDYDNLFVYFFAIVVLLGVLYIPSQTIDTLLVRNLVLFDRYTTGLSRENMFLSAIDVPTGLLITLLGNLPLILIYASGFIIYDNPSDDCVELTNFYS